MRMKDKIAFTLLGLLIFFVSGGVACTYFGTGAVNTALAVVLGVLVFFTVGGVACTVGGNRMQKKKAAQVAQ
jgi:hypothetical protein